MSAARPSGAVVNVVETTETTAVRIETKDELALDTADTSPTASALIDITQPFGDRIEEPTPSDGVAVVNPRHGHAGRELRGRIEKATTTRILGWAWDPQMGDERIRLELRDGDTVLLTAIADKFRPELVPLGCGDGCCGFEMTLPDGLAIQNQHILTLRCAETGAPVPGSPIIWDRAPDAPPSHGTSGGDPAPVRPPPFRSYIDKVTDAGILGWIMLPDRPAHRYVVALKERGRVLARTVASQFRLDLLSAGVGDGCYGFVLEPPRWLPDGETHFLEVVEEGTDLPINIQPIPWRAGPVAGISTSPDHVTIDGLDRLRRPEPDPSLAQPGFSHAVRPDLNGERMSHATTRPETHLLFDISDLVYYIGHHPNLTGIQRVQSSVVLSLIEGNEFAPSSATFLSFDATTRNWVTIPTGFLASLLHDLFLPPSERLVTFSGPAARHGVLPGARPFNGSGILGDGVPSVLCLLGAAWVYQDYLHRVLSLKRQFGTRFVMTIHDLIPIYARDTCDQDTSRVFEDFMQRTLRHVDHILAVSDHTAKDIRRYLASLHLPEPPMTVTKNGSSFSEFLRQDPRARTTTRLDLPDRFVLFVATVEGRKNHRFIFDIWRRMVESGDDPPHLICVGRLGWKASAFVSDLVETHYLDGKIRLLREISDTDLHLLYARCLFTLCPSSYEGWGLPVGEALGLGKICVCSDRASIPEVAGDCGVYIDIDDATRSLEVIRDLIRDDARRAALEARIRRDYVPVSWGSVAQVVARVCRDAANIRWEEPYPFATVPYSTEVTFGRLEPELEGKGESLLTRIVDARLGHFTFGSVDRQSAWLGQEIRSLGIWAEPEPWGSWLCHGGGELIFNLEADESRFYYVSVRLRVCGALSDSPVTLSGNDERLWEGTIGHRSTDIMLRVPKHGDRHSRWRLRIQAECDVAPETLQQLGVLDSRIPTIGFERLIVVPERDVVTRLDMMTKRLL